MQMIHNEYLTAEQNAAIEKEIDTPAAQILANTEAELDKEIEAEESTLFNPFAELDIELA